MRILGTPNHWLVGFSINYFGYLEPHYGFDLNRYGFACDIGKVSFGAHWWKSKSVRKLAAELNGRK